MFNIPFSGLGTVWMVMLDVDDSPTHLSDLILELVIGFEKQYSRFLPESEISMINKSPANEVIVSDQLAQMLLIGSRLKEHTKGQYDLNVTNILEGLGYDSTYSFKKDKTRLSSALGKWRIRGNVLTKTGLVKLDLGSLGKGFLIDSIAKLLKREGQDHFLIDGGGDIYASTKRDGSPFMIAIEHPVDREKVFAKVALANESISTSSGKYRRSGEFHHLIDPFKKESVKEILSVSILGKNGVETDACATAFFVTDDSVRNMMASEYELSFLIVKPDLTYTSNSNRFEVFTK